MGNGIVGIVGDGSLGELATMAARMPYRGQARLWSPATRVFLGELSLDEPLTPSQGDGALALDSGAWLYDLDPAIPPTDTVARRQAERTRLLGSLTQGAMGPAVAQLRGFFALAFWDSRQQRLILACDRQGYKGLYFALLGERIAFASDYKALLALADCPASVDRQVLQTYLLSRSFSSATSLLEAAQPVGRANILSIGLDLERRHESYWAATRRPPTLNRFGEAAQKLRATLERVLLRQISGQSRVAVSLSGGLDSTALLALIKHLRPDIEVATYTIGNGGEDVDILQARRTVEQFRTEHHEIIYDIERIAADLQRFVWLTEDITGREEALFQHAIAAEAQGRDRLLIAGHGADATLAGMPRHRLLWLRDRAPPPLRGALDEFFEYTQRLHPPQSWLGKKLVNWKFRGHQPLVPKVIGASPAPAPVHYPTLDDYRFATLTKLEALRYHEPVDADCGLTLVAPFLDPEVFEFSLDCPTRFLINLRSQKRALRAALEGIAPPTMTRLPKTIQKLKYDARLSQLLRDFAHSLQLEQTLASRGLLRTEDLARASKNAGASSSDRAHLLWTLICTELWLREFIDARGSHSAQ